MSTGETQYQELTVIVNDAKGLQSSGSTETQMMNNENEANTESDFASPAAQPLMQDSKGQEEANKKNSSSGEDNLNNQEGKTENACCAVTCSCTSCWKAFFTPTPIEECKVTNLDFCLLIFSALTYFFDIGTDIWVAVKHHQNGDAAWTALTITCVLVPGIIVLLGYQIRPPECKNQTKEDLLTALSLIIPGGLIIMIMKDIRKAHKAMKSKHNPSDLVEDMNDTLRFRLFEAFGEAAPQLILQLYIILKDTRTIDPIQWITVTTSLVSLSWSLVSFYKTYYMHHRKLKIPHLGVVMCLGWHLCTIWARVVAFAICGIYSHYLIIGILGFHFLVYFIYYFTRFYDSDASPTTSIGYRIVLEALMAVISSFTVVKPKIRRPKYFFLHTLIYLENVCMLLLWLYSPKSYDAPQWHRYLASVSIFAVYLLGVFFQIVYYVDLHPKNFEEDKRKHIQICIPLKEWVRKTEWT